MGSQRPPDEQLKGTVGVTLQDLQWALSAVKPSAMREVAVDVPKVTAPLTLAGALPVALGSGLRWFILVAPKWFLPSSFA